MKFKDWLLETAGNYNYPLVQGDTWNGMKLRDIGSSWNSIGSSFNDYTILPGVRELPYSHFSQIDKTFFYAANDWAKARRLLEDIQNNQEIEPLIIAIDQEGPYILEGGHRFWALHQMGFQTFPAIVVIDEDDQDQ